MISKSNTRDCHFLMKLRIPKHSRMLIDLLDTNKSCRKTKIMPMQRAMSFFLSSCPSFLVYFIYLAIFSFLARLLCQCLRFGSIPITYHCSLGFFSSSPQSIFLGHSNEDHHGKKMKLMCPQDQEASLCVRR
jgi:hypothetical protein